MKAALKCAALCHALVPSMKDVTVCMKWYACPVSMFPLITKIFRLQIKVASLPNARLQVYFLDNEDLFKRKYIFTDEEEKWFDDNGLRTVFFCKGALETVKKFGWPPDIIHCSGWMTGLIPFYLKRFIKKNRCLRTAKWFIPSAKIHLKKSWVLTL